MHVEKVCKDTSKHINKCVKVMEGVHAEIDIYMCTKVVELLQVDN